MEMRDIRTGEVYVLRRDHSFVLVLERKHDHRGHFNTVLVLREDHTQETLLIAQLENQWQIWIAEECERLCDRGSRLSRIGWPRCHPVKPEKVQDFVQAGVQRSKAEAEALNTVYNDYWPLRLAAWDF